MGEAIAESSSFSERDPSVYHVIDDVTLRELLQRAHAGEDPEMLYLELYANGERDDG